MVLIDQDSAEQLLASIQSFYRATRCVSVQLTRQGGHSSALYAVLKHVHTFKDVRAVDLAQQLGIGQSVLSRHLAELESAGMVARVADESDRRVQRLRVTEAGQAALAQGEGLRVQSLLESLAEWSKEDIMTAVQTMDRLGRSLREHANVAKDAREAQEVLAGAK